MDSSFTSVPILDFSQVLSSKPAFLASLREALNVGFFYLQNAPISVQTQEQFIEKALALFELPLEKKLEIEMVNSPHFLGYSRLGAEITALKPDYREQFDLATELPAPGPNEPLYRNVVGPNQWPDETAIPGFREAFDAYLSEVSSLAELFPGLIAEALDLPSTAFDQVFDTPQQHKLKLIKYPPPPGTSNEESGFQGVGPHKDSGFLTFLLQGTPHHGLEVQNKTGTWIPAPPLPGTLVINIGRSLEALTGGSARQPRTALHRHLTDVPHVDIYWFIGGRFDVAPSELPHLTTPIQGSSTVPWRYHFNTVTFSYTTAFWTWEDWESQLDWMALRGVNLPLAWVGQEKIILAVFREIGLNDMAIFRFTNTRVLISQVAAARSGLLIECDPSIKSMILKYDEERHDYIVEDLDDENHLVIKESQLQNLKVRLDQDLDEKIMQLDESESE
ncbi:hypothetical protein N7489_008408 [Penicillium chrysogenum]|uniref:uncharacterized protein n=1 Tax=Penicillium chrysogenum TaxID=5076 RepID=UPI0024DF1946|nr:uncharacterized protein N7489_008408 [Penicillium chrysogenum]KAJ5227700.1 hypothetical protein N7489_008408 [Penicillium chrysogenum]